MGSLSRAPQGVELRGVEKRYGEVVAVRSLNLAVRPGELMVLVGPSGCGKSTLLRLIAGLIEPTAGEVWIGGRRVDDVEPGARDVAMVFQSYALYPHMTVAGNLGFGLRVRGTPRAEIEQHIEETADVLGLTGLLSRKPGELSGGQRQRVALGRAMVRDPGVFLFDEPLSNLDAELRLRTRDEIAALHRRLGTTMIFVTHDQVEALSLGQRVAVMDRGRLHQVGTPEEIYRRPRNLFVAGFVGSPPINRISLDRGTLAVRPEDLVLAATSDGDAPGGDRDSGEAGDFRATVLRVEALGSEQRVHLDGPGDTEWVARVSPSPRVAPGDRVKVSVAWERSHLFGPDGRREEATPQPMDLSVAR